MMSIDIAVIDISRAISVMNSRNGSRRIVISAACWALVSDAFKRLLQSTVVKGSPRCGYFW